MTISTGSRLGSYEVAEQIGSGGMGEVWRARDTDLKREVAIKLLPESFAADADRLARFQREAEMLASLNHPNIAQIYGLEKTDGQTAIVMELVEGPTLADRIAQGPIPPDEALGIARQIADALEAAHGRQIVHRDLKPANIKLKPDGAVKVLDFGISKPLDAHVISGGSPVMTTPAVTETGVILGTAAYMSPEQARGKFVDERTDIWAFGCLLFEMLTGQPAFGGEDVMLTLARVLDRDTDLSSMPATISPAVRHTIKLCLTKDARDRIADIRDVRLALEGAFESWPRSAEQAHSEPLWRGALLGVGGLVVGALAAGFVVSIATPPAPPPLPLPPAPVSRFLVTPPATALLANTGGYDLAISPDGSRLAYLGQDPETGSMGLYVRELDELEARRIVGPEYLGNGIANYNPFFSSDGNWVAFRSPSRGIMRVAVGGGPPLQIADDSGTFLGGTWTNDGTVVYSAGDGLYRISAGGAGTPERLTPAASEEGAVTYIAPSLVPGERAVLMSVREGGDDRVAALDLDTGEIKTLVEGGVQNPRYVASGHVVYARGSTLMAVPFDLGELAVTGEPTTVEQGIRQPGAGTAADFAVSASGTLAYVPGTGELETREVVWVDRSGNVLERALSEPVMLAADPRLSPDNGRLVIRSGSGGGNGLWIYDLSGRPPIPLANVEDNRFPVWSPDGAQIAFASNRGGSSAVYTAPADGSMLVLEPAANLQAWPASWSRDGELISIRLPTGPSGMDIFAIDLGRDAEIRDLVATENNEWDPALSPSGHWLAYVSDRTGRPEVWVQRHPDGVPVRISSNGGIEPRWSADERELFYLQGNTMMAVGIETDPELAFDAAEALFSEPFFNDASPVAHSFDVASDGRFLMIRPSVSAAVAGVSASIVVVENWAEELKRLAPAN